MANVQTRNELGQFVKGAMPHNKKHYGPCIVDGCDRIDMKARGLCQKHYKTNQSRERNGIFNSDLSKRLPRTEEHIRNNFAYMKKPGWESKLKGKTYEEIYGEERAINQKKKLSESLCGKNIGKKSPMSGKKHKKESIEKLRKKMIGRYSKEKNYFWNGGSSKEKYNYEFTKTLKEKIRDRDKRRCVECGCPEEELETRLCIHHIDCNKNNNKESNLISMCRSCHMKVHWRKKDWEKYFKNIIKHMEVFYVNTLDELE